MAQQLTIEEIQTKKLKLEALIQDQLSQFMSDCGLNVHDVTLSHMVTQYISDPSPVMVITSVKLDVRLS